MFGILMLYIFLFSESFSCLELNFSAIKIRVACLFTESLSLPSENKSNKCYGKFL
jgi:hypothetical protein